MGTRRRKTAELLDTLLVLLLEKWNSYYNFGLRSQRKEIFLLKVLYVIK
jgi:hypothetical protein